jgi:hypothetical protein
VQTAIAVPAQASAPPIGDAEALKSTLLAATALYFPDATLSTAGAHVAAMLAQLGLRDAMASRLRMFANGATAMRELVAAADDGAVGCTQATEIVATPGLKLVGALPAPFALATVYSAALASAAGDGDAARRFIEALAEVRAPRCASPAASTRRSNRRSPLVPGLSRAGASASTPSVERPVAPADAEAAAPASAMATAVNRNIACSSSA